MIALTTPELWAAIHIPIIKAVQDARQIAQSQSIMTSRVEGVKEWLLRRSGNLPLCISVFEIREHSARKCELPCDMIDILISCCSRWKEIRFSCRPTTISRVSSLTMYDVPILQSLSISSMTYALDETHIWRGSDLLKSPTLKKFCHLGKIKPPIYPVNWSNLTYLCCDHVTSDIMGDLVDVLQRAGHLVRLELGLTEYGSSEPYSSTIISLPCLTTLIIIESDHPQGENMGILGLINAPSLQAISYLSSYDRIGRSPTLIACLMRSPNIRELSVGRPFSLNTLLEFLHHCPALVILHISEGSSAYKTWTQTSNDAFLRAFVQDNTAQCHCPKLEYFRYEPILRVSLHTLRDFVASRQVATRHISHWKAVVANVQYDSVDEPIIREIQSIAVEGYTKLAISFRKSWNVNFLKSLDRGIMRRPSSIDDWWPSAVFSKMTYLQ